MPLTILKPLAGLPSQKKVELDYSEAELPQVAGSIATWLQPKDRVLLYGPMGAGKSTLARAMLEALGVSRIPEGSPTFPIAHEYETLLGAVVHLDLYRLKSEAELEPAGVPAYFWERDAVVFCEWLDQFPGFRQTVEREPHWALRIEFKEEERKLQITKPLVS